MTCQYMKIQLIHELKNHGAPPLISFNTNPKIRKKYDEKKTP